jgi:hypothetical protein
VPTALTPLPALGAAGHAERGPGDEEWRRETLDPANHAASGSSERRVVEVL